MRGFRPYGSFSSSYNETFPPVIKWLLIANAAMFLLPRIVFSNLHFIHNYLGLVPARIWGDFYLWQLVSYMFLHGSLWHILMNMFILWMFGPEIEFTWGTKQFFKYY